MPLNRTTQRTTQILVLLAARSEGMTMSEISSALNMPKASVFDIIQTLRQMYFLREENKRFLIGYMAYEIGKSYQKSKDLFNLMRKYLALLGDEYEMTASLVFYEDDGLVYALEHRSTGSLVSSGVSSGYDFLHASASGKVLLAFMSATQQEKALKKIMYTALTENTIRSKEDFLKELEKVKKQNFALDLREFNTLLTCISTPIFHNKQVLGALTLSGLQVNDADLPCIAERLQEISAAVSAQLISIAV